jgi:DNA polymerase II small subunit/DNA polymerase delta subunit B
LTNCNNVSICQKGEAEYLNKMSQKRSNNAPDFLEKRKKQKQTNNVEIVPQNDVDISPPKWAEPFIQLVQNLNNRFNSLEPILANSKAGQDIKVKYKVNVNLIVF